MATYYESIAGGDDTSRGGSLDKRHQNGGGAAVARARENASPRPTASHTPIVPAAPEPPVQESNSAAPTTAPHEGNRGHAAPGGAGGATAVEEPARVDKRALSDLSAKWVSRSRGTSGRRAVVADPDSSMVTDSFPSGPVNFVTIFGPGRSGKSFFMNALARRDGIFGVSPAAEPCTSGVDLSKIVLSLGEFTRTAMGGGPESTPCVGLVDVEGLGHRHPSHHVRLAVPPMLVSKVIIFNLKDVQRTTALDTLAVLEHAARSIAVGESQNVYGHLIILVRDTFDRADDIHQLIFGEEEADPNANYEDEEEEDEEGEERKRRNSTRKTLKNIFREIKVWCLPQPHCDINDKKHFALSELKPEFHAKLDELRRYMGGVLATPHTFGGRNITGGATLQLLMTTLCDAVSTRKPVEPLSMMESIEAQAADSLSNRGAKEFEGLLRNFDAASVWSVEAMENKLAEARGTVLTGFEDATKELQKGVTAVARQALEGRIDDQADAFRTTMEMDRIKLDQTVRLLNERAYALVEQEATSTELPVADPAAFWRELCDTTFEYLEWVLDGEGEDKGILRHLPGFVNREGFEKAVQDKYQRFKQRNSAKLEKMEADKVIQQLETRVAEEREQREGAEKEAKFRANEDSIEIASLQEDLRKERARKTTPVEIAPTPAPATRTATPTTAVRARNVWLDWQRVSKARHFIDKAAKSQG